MEVVSEVYSEKREERGYYTYSTYVYHNISTVSTTINSFSFKYYMSSNEWMSVIGQYILLKAVVMKHP